MSASSFPDNWQVIPLAKAVDALIDYRGKTPKKTESGIPLITAKIVKGGNLLPATEYISEDDYDSWMVRGLPEVGDIVVTTEAPLGEVAQLTDANVALAQRIVTLRGAKGLLLNDYLRYVMKGGYVQGQLESRASGSTVKGIKQSELRKVLIPIPPLQEQGVIAAVLKTIDDKIQLNHQINQTLEQIAQAIFKSWFVDFEPVKAKIAARERWHALQAGNEPTSPVCYAGELEGQPIDVDLDTYMNLAAMQAISGKDAEQLAQMQAEQPDEYAELCATAELFPSSMQDSELGEVPEGWETGVLADLVEFNPRRSLKKGQMAPYLDMKNVPTSGHLADEVIDREMVSGTKFINGDTLLARITPCLENGKTAFVDFLDKGQVGWGSTEYIVMRPREGYPDSIAYFVARNAAFRQHAIQSMMGTSGRQRANAHALAELPWVLAPQKILAAFDRISGVYLRVAKSRGDESRTLSSIRDALLPKLLGGELLVAGKEGR